jgi:hypothetical protein
LDSKKELPKVVLKWDVADGMILVFSVINIFCDNGSTEIKRNSSSPGFICSWGLQINFLQNNL